MAFRCQLSFSRMFEYKCIPIVGLMSTVGCQSKSLPFATQILPFSFSMMSLNNHGAKWPRGSIETIFFLSAHCGKGPMFAAGSVFVKSGLEGSVPESRQPFLEEG